MSTTRNTVERLMTINDVARILNVHQMTVRNLVRRKELDVTWVGCSMRWTNQQVESYIKRATNRKRESPAKLHADATQVQARQKERGNNTR
jgi:excisionase family DNA binding protein